VVKEFHRVPPVHALRGELHQVASNLVSNAIDAMPDGGELYLTVKAVEPTGRRGVEIRVRDTGPGIPPDIQPKLFEPFFTTKTSVGTGLGLWVVKQFVENHSGTVTVQSKMDKQDHGTSFVVFLPLSAKAPAGSLVM
jgi:signal transduction histidine kinase